MQSPPGGEGLSAGSPGEAAVVWVTRARPGAERTAMGLAALGFTPLVAPLIETRDLPGSPPDLTGVAALAFTSVRGVRAFTDRAPPAALPVFTVGDATAEAARAAGFGDVRSAHGAGRDLLRLILREAPPGGAVLYAGARDPAFDLVGALRQADRPARSAPLYETLPCGRLPEAAQAALAQGGLRAILIHSPAAAQGLAAGLLAEPANLAGVHLAALSKDCAAPLRATPFAAVHTARTPDEPSLLDALLGAGLAHG